MSSGIESLREALSVFKRNLDGGHLAHAHVVISPEMGQARQFTLSALQLLFCEAEEKPCAVCRACRAVAQHHHSDVHWVEPENKSRSISVEQVRQLIWKLSQSAFEGGWKAAVIVDADCFNDASANALLKTLEEPPAQTLLLLVTTQPEALLATIISRCQRIALSGDWKEVTEAWQPLVLELLSESICNDPLQWERMGAELTGILDHYRKEYEKDIKAQSKDLEIDKGTLDARVSARLSSLRSGMMQSLMLWQRDLLLMCSGVDDVSLLTYPDQADVLADQAAELSASQVIERVRVVEEMARRLGQHIPPVQVFSAGWAAMSRA